MERDLKVRAAYIRHGISTHTLTWSVTGKLSGLDKLSEISTHTLTWSVTKSARLPETASRISTHTLTWSVTCQLTQSD